jgi:CubicO group peptidase (beta-lactamase class C family)
MNARYSLLIMPLLAGLIWGCGAVPNAVPTPATRVDPTAAPAGATALTGATLPNTPAGNQLRVWLQAFNTGDRKTMRRFIAERYAPSILAQFPADEQIFEAMQLFNATRGLQLRRIEQSNDTIIAALFEAPLVEEWRRLEIEVAPAAPHQITRTELDMVPNPNAAGGKLSDEQIAQALGGYLDKLVAANLFSGTVLVAKDGKPIFQQAYGLANQQARLPNTLETRFNLASMNKMFTAVAIAQLVQQGKLSFDEPISAVLPDYPKPAADQVTVHHLLTHTAGLGDYMTEAFERAKPVISSPRDYFPFFIDQRLAFQPGARFQYSNAGFVLLGAIIEQVSGQSYYDYIREHIFEPAGMANSDYSTLSEGAPDRAEGYTYWRLDGPQWASQVSSQSTLPTRGGPAGGGYSTAPDLLDFARALLDHKLLNAAFTDLVTTGKVSDGGDTERKYAYGFGDIRSHGERVIGHNGGSPGVNTQLDILPNRGYVIVVLSNYDPPSAGRVCNKARQLITQS